MHITKPTIGITMGDPAGVGPEIVLKSLVDPILLEQCTPIVFGDARVLARCATELKICGPSFRVLTPTEFFQRQPIDDEERPEAQQIEIVDLANVDVESLTPGAVAAECGRASFEFIQRAIDASLAGLVDAVTTAPINKEALKRADIHYPGHTEMFAERAGSSRWCMMQYSLEITCTFVTVHVGYNEVPALITKERVLETIELTHDALRKIRGKPPVIVVCGLNPHAGEHGLFGNGEEESAIIPAIMAARKLGIQVEGPLPPDTAFLPWKRKSTDAFVCMYHDQGHIPVKALAFDSAVNTTLGLDIIRTSVDHGTAYDIAWQGKASTSSMFAAIQLASDLAISQSKSH